ncbi:MAG: class I SAM-dependent methyltransferase, partial [Sphingomonadales bacterium]|nr:class I SAM-dependent methyltransferase [Sphingomonadales bacterium]
MSQRQAPRDLFDRRRRALCRDRAARAGAELFLLDAGFDECLDRLRTIARRFDRALLIGAPSPEWPTRLSEVAAAVEVVDPGTLFAAAAGGRTVEEDRHDFGEARFDLTVAVGTLDTVNDLPLALQRIRFALAPDSPLIGAIAGGDSLAALRAAMIEADRATGSVAARTHPRIEPSALAGLLQAAGFAMPVVDIERQRFGYRDLWTLARDLRAMGASNMLADRVPGKGKAWAARAAAAFEAQGKDGRT